MPPEGSGGNYTDSGPRLCNRAQRVRRVTCLDMARSPLVRRLLPCLVVPVLLLSGCGDGGDKADLKERAEERAPGQLAAGLFEDYSASNAEPVLSEEDADCVSGALIEEFGVEGLGKVGVLGPDGTYAERPRSLSQTDAERWAAAFDGCLDMRQYLWRAASAATLLEHPYSRDKADAVWDRAEACVLDAVTEEQVTSSFIGTFTGSRAGSDSDAAVVACLAPLRTAPKQQAPQG